MPKGGKRNGAGRKTTWASGRGFNDTTVIRVPKEFANRLLEIAHKLDAGENLDFVANSNYNTASQSNIVTISAGANDSGESTKSSVLHEEVVLVNVTKPNSATTALTTESNEVEIDW
jgi:hypothetical protein